jgi:CRP-like cAMP-binding protein
MATTTAKTQKCFLVLETFTDFCFEICKFLFFCYFFACFWYFLSRLVEDKYSTEKNFLKYFEIHEKPKNEQVLVIFYFIFTTLTTVGYGDYLAKNSEEMGLCILMMLVGSAWLALTMSKVISFVKEFEKIGKPKDNLRELTVFIHNLEHIHGPMTSDLKSKLFKHFQYFWKNDRLGSLMNPDWSVKGDQLTFIHDNTLRKLPEHIQTNIIEYLFQDYFSIFFKFFGYIDNFRFDIALHLQPRFYDQEFILFMEETAKELLFVKSGKVLVGFLKDDQSFVTCFKLPKGVIVGESSVFLDEKSFADLNSCKVQGMALPENVVLEILKHKYPEKMKEYVSIVKKRLASLKRTLQDSENFKERFERSKISARLSAVFHKTVEKQGAISLREIYTTMKTLKQKQERLQKEINSINSTYFD